MLASNDRELPQEVEARTLARFERHRRAFQSNRAVRELYTRWYGKVAAALPPRGLGPWVELGSGPGLAKEFIPELELSDVVRAPWHDHRISAEKLPFEASSLGAIVLFDVLHHLPAPSKFFAEATRVLRAGGRVVICEPYVSPLSYPVYRFLHEEGLSAKVDPFDAAARPHKDPFEGNQIVPKLIFCDRRAEFEGRFPDLHIERVEYLSGPSYPASGGFAHRPFIPTAAWRALVSVEDRFPEAVFRWIGFRMFVSLARC